MPAIRLQGGQYLSFLTSSGRGYWGTRCSYPWRNYEAGGWFRCTSTKTYWYLYSKIWLSGRLFGQGRGLERVGGQSRGTQQRRGNTTVEWRDKEGWQAGTSHPATQQRDGKERKGKEEYLYSTMYILRISQSGQAWITQFYLQIHYACL